MVVLVYFNSHYKVYIYNLYFLEHYLLDNPDWKYDAVPEIMDGKNVYDFVDADILERLEELEKEEEMME